VEIYQRGPGAKRNFGLKDFLLFLDSTVFRLDSTFWLDSTAFTLKLYTMGYGERAVSSPQLTTGPLGHRKLSQRPGYLELE